MIDSTIFSGAADRCIAGIDDSELPAHLMLQIDALLPSRQSVAQSGAPGDDRGRLDRILGELEDALAFHEMGDADGARAGLRAVLPLILAASLPSVAWANALPGLLDRAGAVFGAGGAEAVAARLGPLVVASPVAGKRIAA